TVLADPHVGWIHDARLSKLERHAVVDVAADVLLVRQELMDGGPGPLAAEISPHAHAIEAASDLRLHQPVVDEPAVDLVHDVDLLLRTRCEDHPVRLQALLLAPSKFGLGVALLVDENSTQPISGWTALSEAQFDQTALPGEHL